MNHKARHILLALLMLVIALGSTFTASSAQNATSAEVKGVFSRNGLVLTITSQAEYEELWVLQIEYCDGSREDLGRHSRRGIFRQPLTGQGFTFYAEKPMRRVVIHSLPVEGLFSAPNLRQTVARRGCGDSTALPNLSCRDVQVAQEIHRVWEGTPITFISTPRVYFASLKFPGVDGLAPARVADFRPKRYAPSIEYKYTEGVWTGTFMSIRLPLGEYEKVELVVQDIYGQQAKCPVGNVTVLP